ncbi:MAG: Helix-turn-helix domain [Segetibacter sp.]|jgi:transcriptional regulator with XRE-family HTH domain|nr:Helix-turn-helix domain [Segetibacter sp.]
MNQRIGVEHNKKNVGKLIRIFRQKAHYKSEYVAKKLSISAGNYSKLENGQIDLTDSRLSLLCRVYQITPPEFYLHFKYY